MTMNCESFQTTSAPMGGFKSPRCSSIQRFRFRAFSGCAMCPSTSDRLDLDIAELDGPGGGVHPGQFPRRENRGDPSVAGGLVLVGADELAVRDLEHRAWHTIVASPIEPHDGMVSLAARRHELRVLDLQQRLLEPDQLVGPPVEPPPERRPLHRLLLERAV